MSGLFYEDFEPGLVLRHAVTRSVTETDNLLFTTLTMNVQPLHLDIEAGAASPCRRPQRSSGASSRRWRGKQTASR